MSDKRSRLKFGASAAAIIVASSFGAASAYAQAASNTDETVESVVVTGTNIRGADVAGTNIITMSAQDLEAAGAQTAQQALADIPEVSGFGNAGEGGTIHNNYYQPSIHQLGASAANGTLVIIDGARAPTGGTNHTTVDPNIVPTNMIERVDIIANGDSSIYGSDAVAGVINFVTRSKFDGIELSGSDTSLNGADNYTMGVVMGTSWATGNVIFGYQFYNQGKLLASDRSFSENPNQTAQAASAGLPIGTSASATNFDTFSGCPVALVQVNGAGNYYNMSTGQQYSTATSSAPCNTSYETALIQHDERNNVMMKMKQTLAPNLTFSSTMDYGERLSDSPASIGTLSQVTVYATGPQANPFFEAPPGYSGPPITSEKVNINLDGILGNPGGGIYTRSGADTFYANGTLEYNILNNFVVDLLTNAGRDDSYSNVNGNVDTSAAYLSLNGTTNTGGSPTTPSVGGTTEIDTQTLTDANALDIWQYGANNRTSATTKAFVLSDQTINHTIASYWQERLSTNGTVMDLPGGPLKIAVGAEYYKLLELKETTAANGTGPTITGSGLTYVPLKRTDDAAFGEMYMPIVSPSMNVPLVEKLEVDVSGRYDDYNDSGVTTNYKMAASWDVIDGLTLRANMSTSFVAPTLDESTTLINNLATSTSPDGVAIPTGAYPAITQFAPAQYANGKACAAGSASCTLASSVQGTVINGGNPNNKPEKGRGWEVGADFNPTFLPGLRAQATFWNTEFLGAITGPNIGNIVNSPGMNSLLTFYPSGLSQAQVQAAVPGVRISGTLPPESYYIWSTVNSNYLYLYIDGIDANVSYTFDTDAGTFTVGDSATSFLKYNEAYGAGTTPFNILNTTNANTSFPSVSLQMRGNLDWVFGNYSADVFANYTGPYRNWSGTSVIALTHNAQGYPAGGGDPVKADLTFDLHLGYTFDSGVLGNDQVGLTVKDVANTAPPFYLGYGAASGGYGYDTWVASPLGREFEIDLKAKF